MLRLKSIDPEKAVIYWQTELWQILRYHAGAITVNLEISPDYGAMPIWTIEIYYQEYGMRGERIFCQHGTNLWKRLRNATFFLKEFYGDNAYKYQTDPVKKIL